MVIVIARGAAARVLVVDAKRPWLVLRACLRHGVGASGRVDDDWVDDDGEHSACHSWLALVGQGEVIPGARLVIGDPHMFALIGGGDAAVGPYPYGPGAGGDECLHTDGVRWQLRVRRPRTR